MDLISPEQPKLLQILKAPQASRISNGILFYTGQELHELPVCCPFPSTSIPWIRNSSA